MNTDDIKQLLEQVRTRKVSVEDALGTLRDLPFEELDFARVDNHRDLRCGFPEVIFCEGKRPGDITAISRVILDRSSRLLATRADPEAFDAVRQASADARYHERARCVTVAKQEPPRVDGRILILTAGTADIPVAEEARVTADIMGHEVETIYDVGVAGIHRVLAQTDRIHDADCLVVVAGMEGALASVVGGLSANPGIAVPTSGGYGASFGGIAPLLTMLNSCAAGVAVVNIDNGFGAGHMAALVARTRTRD